MILKFDIHSFWHAGTGRGDGPERDALVKRSKGGLPILPAKTIAGLCREAFMVAEAAGVLTTASSNCSTQTTRTEELFGTWSASTADNPGTGRFESREGLLDFRTARLGITKAEQQGWEQWADDHPVDAQSAYSTLQSTKISETTGTAEKYSLRKIEVAVPLCLHAEVTLTDNSANSEGWENDFCLAMPLVRSLGASRSRGLGRVAVSTLTGIQ